MDLNNFGEMDFRHQLQLELVNRCRKNPRYSLRAFAKSLGIHHATLSHLISGKRPLNARYISRLGKKMGFSEDRLSQIAKQVIKQARPLPATYTEFSLEHFFYVSEWYYDAILELTKIEGFKPDMKWIARTLSLDQTTTQEAVNSLIRLGLLDIKDGIWKDLSENNSTSLTPELTSAALRHYLRGLYLLAAQNIDSVPRSQRMNTSNILAIRSGDVEKVQKLIDRFRFNISKYLQRKGGPPDRVYSFSISFMPLSQNPSHPENL